MANNSSVLSIYSRLACVPAIWGGTFIAGRVVSTQLTAVPAAFMRFFFATAALLLVLQFSQGLRVLRHLTAGQWLSTMALGATGVVAYNLFFFAALATLPAGRSALVVALNPAITLLLAAGLCGERLSPTRWCGIGLALLGVWIVVTHGELSRLLKALGQGEMAMLGAVLAWAAYTLVGRVMLKDLSPLVATCCSCIWGTLLLGLIAAWQPAPIPWTSMSAQVWGSLAFLGIFGTAVAFVWYFKALQTLGTARTVVFNNLVPLFAVFWGWSILNEPVSVSMLSGAGLTMVGVFLVNGRA